MILLSFFVFKFKVPSFPVFLERLVLLPVLDAFLKPLFHETSIASHFVNLSCSHLLKKPLSCFPFLSVSLLGDIVLTHSFIFKFLKVLFHDYLLLRLVQFLKALMEESLVLPLIWFLSIWYLHRRTVIAYFASYKWQVVYEIYCLLFLRMLTSVGGYTFSRAIFSW